ncbi:putative L-type amino acid transporter 1-like protein MLAS isoform X2 [Eurytemora carolleeae]|uniref:putative L-type amino acid transporter 1-like protein MLAS isoform X2 n=1 Tax=Eurytemora carolleeae TaxID=1294199 RepID=UPI000C789183|nr:putative L-type amino acid transporter 1-like protein MLAS isoform X2 [Eurytemora carolleeae]|eukprot:XP_023332877.1 putative L-type amino acid transporter 1-like protein MLAS isoform X2 [Eurytemora affinis]
MPEARIKKAFFKISFNMADIDKMVGKEEYKPVPQNEPEKMVPMEMEDAEQDNVGLKPKMTLLNGCTVIVGSIIGSGIFVSPSGVLAQTGSVNMSLVVWITSGIFSMIGAYCYAELGCMIKKTGADYAYIMVTFGSFLAFIRLWAECLIVRPCTITIVALTFSKEDFKNKTKNKISHFYNFFRCES